ncbi:MAG: J domain-containing protein [Rhizobiaceae bacterium]|nr:J domain-containing protein [Rhizobiaceae bacterium]
MRDPYEVLGVAKSATAKEIKSAYRKLAKKYHPDQNPDDPKAKERFNAATQAYDIVGDDAKRASYERGEIDAEGKPKFQGFESAGGDPFAGFRRQQAGPGGSRFEFRSGGDAGDIFGDIFGQAFGGRPGMGGGGPMPPGRDLNAALAVSVEEVATAAKVQAIFPDGRKMAVKLPHYVEDGQTIRLKGQGEQGPGGAGDALVKIQIRSHPRYRVEGRDLHVDLPVAIEDAVLGAKLAVETPSGRLGVTVPAWSSSDKVLRLKGKGLPVKTGGHADLYVHLRVMLPEKPDADIEALARQRRG